MRSLLAALVGCALTLASTTATVSAQQEPPRRLDFSQDTLDAPNESLRRAQQPRSSARNAFIRDQTILGLVVYGPAFAATVGDNGVTATAGYLVMAGGTFFAAAELSRRMDITEARQLLSTRMAVRSAASALYISASADSRASTNGAATLIGGLGGTVMGLAVGKGLTAGEAMATVFGHDLAFASAAAIAYAADPNVADERGLSDQMRAVVLTASGLSGYVLGRFYAGRAPYNVTEGDVDALWIGTAIGATAAGAVIAESDPDDQTTALSLLAGGLLGTALADRVIVRRYDHTRAEGRLLALGGAAGGLMGIGVGVLVAGEADRGGALTLGLGVVGASAGVVLTERYLMPLADAGRQFGLGRLTIDPAGLAAVAARARGTHSLVRFTF